MTKAIINSNHVIGVMVKIMGHYEGDEGLYGVVVVVVW